MVSFEECNTFKDMIRNITFLDHIVSADRLTNFFAMQMQEQIINKMALTTPHKHTNIVEESSLTKTMKLLELNNRMWSVYKYPVKEYKRQGCNFYSLSDAPDRRWQQNASHQEALFQIYDN